MGFVECRWCCFLAGELSSATTCTRYFSITTHGKSQGEKDILTDQACFRGCLDDLVDQQCTPGRPDRSK